MSQSLRLPICAGRNPDGHEILRHELLSNLLHNAIEYAGLMARLTVRVALRERFVDLEVENSGPVSRDVGRPACRQCRQHR